MPLPLLPLATAALEVGSNIFNAASQGRQNRRSREFSREMYEKQKGDELAFWNMQNEYNSPQQQMQRLRDAGLNPNLVYGKGADNIAAPVHAPSAPAWNPKPAQLDLGGAARDSLMSYYDVQMRDAQLDNLRVQNTVLLQEAKLKEANTLAALSSTARRDFDLEFESELRGTSADMRRETLRKVQSDVSYQLDENERRAALSSQSLMEGAERILNIRRDRARTDAEIARIDADIKRINADTRLRDLDSDLKQAGINPTDPTWQRILARILSPAVNDTAGGMSGGWDWIKKRFEFSIPTKR